MGLLPKIDIDIVSTVNEFLTVLRSIDGKLDELLEEQREANRGATIDRLGRASRDRIAADERRGPHGGPVFCSECDEVGRLRCTAHGPEATAGRRLGDALADASCPVNPTDEALASTFGPACARPLGTRGACSKSLGHSGRCKP